MFNKLSDKNFRQANYFNAFQTFAMGLGWSLIFLFFHRKSFTETEFAAFFIVACLFAMLLISLFKVINIKRFIFSGNMMRVILFVAASFMLISEAFWQLRLSFYIIAFMWGATFFVFWVPFNIVMFRYSTKDSKASTVGIYFAVGTLTSIVVPVAAGFIAEKLGYGYLFGISALLIAVAAWLAYSAPEEAYSGNCSHTSKSALKEEQYENCENSSKSSETGQYCRYELRKALSKFGMVKPLVFLEGIFDSVFLFLIPVIALFFLKTEAEYGVFFSILSIISAFATLLLTSYSDKLNKRLLYISYGLLILAALFVAAAFSGNSTWLILMAAISFVNSITRPFLTTVLLDMSKDANSEMADLMVAREFLLNAGRVFAGIIIFVFMLFGSIMLSFLFIAAACLAYIYVIHRSHIYDEKVTWLFYARAFRKNK